MKKLIYLCLHSLVVLFVIITKAHDRDARPEVEILFAFRIIEEYAVSMIKYDRKTVVCLIKFLFRFLDIFLFIRHGNTSHLPS